MLFASFGTWQLPLAVGVGAILLVIPLLVYFLRRKEFKVIPLLLIPGLFVIGMAGFMVWSHAFPSPPPLLHDLVIIIDTSRSMGHADNFQDLGAMERAAKLSDAIRQKLQEELPGKIEALETELAAKGKKDDGRLESWRKQQAALAANTWRPSRLQLAQAVLSQTEPGWFKTLLARHQVRIHLYHLDDAGRAVKLRYADGNIVAIVDPGDSAQIERVARAVAQLEPVGNESRLGDALRQVIDEFRDKPLAGVVMFTDGVTTDGESISNAAILARDKGIPLSFVGMGDDEADRFLAVHDLMTEDTIYTGDSAVFELRLTASGCKNLEVPVVLKVKTKDGAETEVQRQIAKVDPIGKPVRLRLVDNKITEPGRRRYVIAIEPPAPVGKQKPITLVNGRLERVIDVMDARAIKVLYVEGQPRFEFRAIKSLFERLAAADKEKAPKKRAVQLKVLLLDADDDWYAVDAAALRAFPPTLDELRKYDLVILGDCDPNHKMLRNHLTDIRRFARGDDEQDKPKDQGGGLLFIAGAVHNPHRYVGTPLADVLPVELLKDQVPEEALRTEKLRPELTPLGRMHPIFRFSLNEEESKAMWDRLEPMYWNSSGYKIKPGAEALVVHPSQKAALQRGADDRHPLVVQQLVGGRSMFIGFDETWRWRFREHEGKFDSFWMQTVRFLSRPPHTRARMDIDKQVNYSVGDAIMVTARFPAHLPLRKDAEVKVTVTYDSPRGNKPEISVLTLTTSEDRLGEYRAKLDNAREGTYRFELTSPAVQPDAEKPSARAVVVPRLGELDRLGMNYAEMLEAAESSRGVFVAWSEADQLLERLPRKNR